MTGHQLDPAPATTASYGVDKATALALASPVLGLRVTQVANQPWGVHALLPAGAIS
jgi:acetamidase/formamidase